MEEVRQDDGYQKMMGGLRGLIRFLIYVVAILFILYLGKTAYHFGYLVFDNTAMTSEDYSREVTVQIPEDTGVYDIGVILKDNGLIRNPLVFWAQEKLSDYRGDIVPGIYILNTSQTVEEMLEILAGVNTEGQPAADETAEDTQE